MLRKKPNLDIVRIQDSEVSEQDDTAILAWTARENRILLTHDIQTITGYAYERVEAGLPMPGVFEVEATMPIGQAIEDLLLLVECSEEDEWEGQVCFIPLH